VPDALREKLSAAVGPANVLTGIELSPYVVEGRTPDAAVFPGSIDEVAAVVGIAAREGVPVTPWGGGSAASDSGFRPRNPAAPARTSPPRNSRRLQPSACLLCMRISLSRGVTVCFTLPSFIARMQSEGRSK